MKSFQLFVLFLACTATWADSAWQHLPLPDSAKALLPTQTALYVVLADGTVTSTVDGSDWQVARKLGGDDEQTQVVNVLHTESGLVVWARGIKGSQVDWQRIYRSTTGEDWESVADAPAIQASASQASLTPPTAIGEGWFRNTERKQPAVVWYSVDGFLWEEVYRDEARAFASGGELKSGLNPALKFAEPYAHEWITTEDGRDWIVVGDQPSQIIRTDSVVVGLRSDPMGQRGVYYSEDGEDWEVVFTPELPRFPKTLLYANGTFLLLNGYDEIYFSRNGRDWQAATFPAGAISGNQWLFKWSLTFSDGSFYYKLVEHPPPYAENPTPVSFAFSSVDGFVWSASVIPESLVDEAVRPGPNPDFRPAPGPGYNPSQLGLLAEKEVSSGDWFLKMALLPEGRQMGLYFSDSPETYSIINTDWGQPDATYPYTAPLDVAEVNGVFFALNKTGRIGLMDPGADYLPQPFDLTSTMGTLDDRIVVKWQPAEGADAYRVYRSTRHDLSDRVVLGDIEGVEFVDTYELDLDTRYIYQVQSLGEGRTSLLSAAETGQLWSIKMQIVFCVLPDHQLIDVGLAQNTYWGATFGGVGSPILETADSSAFPWIRSAAHGWQYCVQKPGSLWLWDSQLGWLWTRQNLYPNLYVNEAKEWRYFAASGATVRWFYNFADRAYVALER